VSVDRCGHDWPSGGTPESTTTLTMMTWPVRTVTIVLAGRGNAPPDSGLALSVYTPAAASMRKCPFTSVIVLATVAPEPSTSETCAWTGMVGQPCSVNTGHVSVTVVPCTPVVPRAGVLIVDVVDGADNGPCEVEAGPGLVVEVAPGARVTSREPVAWPPAVAAQLPTTTASAPSTTILADLTIRVGRLAPHSRCNDAGTSVTSLHEVDRPAQPTGPHHHGRSYGFIR
jgi:hypothetical protein